MHASRAPLGRLISSELTRSCTVRHVAPRRVPQSLRHARPTKRGASPRPPPPHHGLTSFLAQLIRSKIRLFSQSHVVHPGLAFFAQHPPGTKIDPSLVPGLKESGWTPEMDQLCVRLRMRSPSLFCGELIELLGEYRTRRPKRGPQFAVMKKLLTLMIDHPSSWAFANPVNAEEVRRVACKGGERPLTLERAGHGLLQRDQGADGSVPSPS